MKQLRAYLVDFDGTLADTGSANYQAYSSALLEAGISFSREQFDKVAFGRNWRQFLPLILEQHGSSADPAAITARKVELYRSAAARVDFNEALLFLLKGRPSDVRAALVTAASAENVRSVFESRRELQALFDVIITGDDVSRHKPDPQGYAMAAQSLGVAPENCLVFEDSDIGVAAGQAFGARVLRICF